MIDAAAQHDPIRTKSTYRIATDSMMLPKQFLMIPLALHCNPQSISSRRHLIWRVIWRWLSLVLLSLAGTSIFFCMPQTLLAQEESPTEQSAIGPQQEFNTSLTVQEQSGELTVATEQVITIGLTDDPLLQQLGTLLEVILSDQGHHVVTKNYVDLPALLIALERAEISMGLALPVDALVLHYRLPLNALPTDTVRMLQLVDNMAGKKDMHWLAATLVAHNYRLFTFSEGNAPPGATAPEEETSATEFTTLPELAEQIERGNLAPTICLESDVQPLWATIEDAFIETYLLPLGQMQSQVLREPITIEGALRDGCDLFFGSDRNPFTTNGELSLIPLTDPDRFFPQNHPSLVAHRSTMENWPELDESWSALVNVVDERTLTELESIEAESRQNEESSTSAGETIQAGAAKRNAAAYQFLITHGLVELPTITVSTRDETAQNILGAIVVQLMESAGYSVIDQTGALNAVDAISEIEAGKADVVIALLGEVLTLHYAVPLDRLPAERSAALALLNESQADPTVTILQPVDFSLTRVLLVDKDLAGLGVTTLSRLAAYMNQFEAPFTICTDSEFFSHPITGLAELETFYGFHFAPAKIRLMDEDTIFTAIQEGQCQVTVGTITDGRIAAWNLLPLRDDNGFFPPNHPLTVINQSLLTRQPQLAERLERYIPLLDTATMQGLTTLVELGADGIDASGDELSTMQAAQAFLEDHNLLEPGSQQPNEPLDSDDEAASGLVEIGPPDEGLFDSFEELPGLSTTTEDSDE